MIELACEKESDALEELGKNIAMQIAALNPQFIATKDVPQEFIDKETEIRFLINIIRAVRMYFPSVIVSAITIGIGVKMISNK